MMQKGFKWKVVVLFLMMLSFLSIAHGQGAPTGRTGELMSVASAGGVVPASQIQWIDVHNHLMTGHQRDYAGAIKAALAVMDQIGIQKMIVMPPPKGYGMPGDQNEINSLSTVVRQNASRFAFVAGGESLNVILQQASKQNEVSESLKQQFEQKAIEILNKGAIGFGEMAIHHLSLHGAEHPYESVSADHPLFLLLADIAAAHDVPIEIHFDVVTEDMQTPSRLNSPNNPAVLRANIAGFERLLEHNPKAKICWAHVGSDNTGHWTVTLSRRLLQKHPNLYMSLRLGPGQVPANFPMTVDRQFKPEWLQLLKDFPDRFVIGSDNFIASASFQGRGSAAMLAKRIPATRTWTPVFLNALPPDLARKIAYENALALYKIRK